MNRFSFRLAVAILTAGYLPAEDNALPRPEPAFQGKIDPSREKSEGAWPKLPSAPEGAPNVIVILLDDVGYGATSVFGGPVKTPALEKLAADGLRYNRFHVNSLCSPTRAALLSGRNDHQLGFGTVVEGASPYPGYNAMWPKSAASMAEILRQNGYSTAAFGKWHNTPLWEVSPAGPFDRWPTSLGFEYFYGFIGGADNQWHPRLFRNTTPVEPPNKPGYHLTTDLADEAIGWVHKHDAIARQKPFLLYFATGATHEPHHVSEEWISKFKGQFDTGWDALRQKTFARQKEFGVIPATAELTPRPKELPAWDSLTAGQKKLLSHQMEVYAGFLAQTDYEIGRMLAQIRAAGHVNDTAVFYIVGDNGASAEGGLDGKDMLATSGAATGIDARLEHVEELGGEIFRNHYAAAWAWACNTPFQWTKQVASHLGGTRDPLIVSWPGHIKDAGSLRSQFHHVTDIAPTIFELAHVQFPDTVNGVKQLPLEGKSLAYSFDQAQAESPHHVQYFEMLGNRGIYKDGWWAGSRNILPWKIDLRALDHDPNQNSWELYDLSKDFSQAHDLATADPEKLNEMKELFDSEARRNQVYPLTPRFSPQPSPGGQSKSFVYHDGIERVHTSAGPQLGGKSHRITASVEIPKGGAEGVIFAEGGRYGGFSLFVKDGRVNYSVNAFGNDGGRVVASEPLTPGRSEIVVDFTPDAKRISTVAILGNAIAPGTARLSVNGKVVGEGAIANLGGYYLETLDVGSDLGTPVSTLYSSPFLFTGHIDEVKIDLL